MADEKKVELIDYTRTTFDIKRSLWAEVKAEAARSNLNIPVLIEKILQERYKK